MEQEIYEEYEETSLNVYDDIDYEAILNADKGFRTEETIKDTAKGIARENHLDEKIIQERLEAINQQDKRKEEREEELQNYPQRELSQEEESTREQETKIVEMENLTQEIQENPKLSQAIGLSQEIQHAQEQIEEILEQKQETYTPQQQLELNASAITQAKENPKINEAIERNLEIQQTQAEIEKLKEQITQQKTQIQKEEQPQTRDTTLNHDINQETNETLEEKLERLQEKVNEDKEELKKLLNEFEPKDVAELLQSLYKLERATLALWNDAEKVAETNAKLREQELLELAEANRIDFILKNVNAITDKLQEAESNVKTLKEEKALYEEINTNHRVVCLW